MKNHTEKRVKSLEAFIRNSTNKITVDDVNAHSFYSYRHANRLFALLKGDSINAYSNKIRIQTGAEYLKYTSRSIFDIALLVGYESSAAFSKAFKKRYGQSPSAFRQTHKRNHLPSNKKSASCCYSIIFLKKNKVFTQKIEISSDITIDDIYSRTIAAYGNLSTPMDQIMLLWDEDPEISQLPKSRFYLGVDSYEPMEHETFNTINIEGRYALFDTTLLNEHAYENLHTLAYLILDIDGKHLREASYIEWFSKASLKTRPVFYPDKIAIPIR